MEITELDYAQLNKRIERIKSSLQGLQRSLEEAQKQAQAYAIALGKITAPDAATKAPPMPIPVLSWAETLAQKTGGKPPLPPKV